MDTELTPALERVAASVIETHRRRQHLEDELAAATAAIASLQEESVSLESSVLDLRKELEGTLEARAREDAALESLTAKRSQAVAQIDELVAQIDAFLGEKERVAGGMAAQVDSSRSALATIEAEIQNLKALFGSVASDATGLQTTVDGVRKSADAAHEQLLTIASKAKDLDAAADGMAARVCRIAEALDREEKNKQHIASAADELRALATKLQARKADAESAAAAVNELARDRERTAAAIARQLEKIDELCAASTATTNGSASERPEITQTDAHLHDTQKAQSQESSSPPGSRYGATLATLDLLATQGLLTPAEASSAAELLRVGGADKLVRAWWSRAMASPAPGYYRLVIGQSLWESEDSKGALTFFNRAMEGKGIDPFITYLVALALLDMKRYVDVLHIAAGLARSKHGKALGQNVEALHLAIGRRYDEAESKLAQALAQPGLAKLHYSETLYNLARLAQEKGDVRAASAWYEKLASIDPAYRGIAHHIESRGAPVAAG